MIIKLNRDMSRLALRVKTSDGGRQLTDWRRLRLFLTRGERGPDCCHDRASPWYFFGCWPGHRETGVDRNAPGRGRPDAPPVWFDAHELDGEGRVVFRFEDRLAKLPNGRYTAMLVARPDIDETPLNFRPVNPTADDDPKRLIPRPYWHGAFDRCFHDGPHEPPERPVRRHVCVLSVFDVDLGPECMDHIIDQAVAEYPVSLCDPHCDDTCGGF